MTSVIGQRARTAAAAAFIACGLLLSAAQAPAQEKHTVLFSASAENSKYTQQHTIDVGDTPGHQMRVYELQRSYGKNGPEIAGVRLKEAWTHGMSDYVELNGLALIYITYVMENGDKIFARGSLTANSMSGADGKKVLTNTSALTITGGTGKFLRIRGVVRTETMARPGDNANTSTSEMEYWMEN
jgi:hypothetical protein